MAIPMEQPDEAMQSRQGGWTAPEPNKEAGVGLSALNPEDERRVVLAACARMLSYPDAEDFVPVLMEVDGDLNNLGLAPHHPLRAIIRRLLASDCLELAEEYVAWFDTHEATTLYLTAHEVGDSRNRGPALLILANIFRAAGFVVPEQQIPDYLPLLLELLVAVDVDEANQAVIRELEARVAAVSRKIQQALPQASVYRAVFDLLVDTLPAPTEVGESSREPQTDVDDDPEALPFPLYYR
ncbi:MAG: nitrate reductase molybdenum cofactor assembly chaperone [Alicyclobacillus sp.]|nr:nitrate reductase molybdenum cofactor assembly chaperone [Alicyclobacillus sp.]